MKLKKQVYKNTNIAEALRLKRVERRINMIFKIPVSFKLDPNVLSYLRNTAKKNGRTCTKQLEMIVEEYMKKEVSK